jgi:hypothetical protein
MPAARAVAAAAIMEAAGRKNDPADLINAALEKLVEDSFELPAYSTLDTMAGHIREQVNGSIFAGVADRDGSAKVTRLDGMLVTSGPGTKSEYNRMKRVAPRPSWTNYRLQIDHLRWVDSFGDSRPGGTGRLRRRSRTSPVRASPRTPRCWVITGRRNAPRSSRRWSTPRRRRPMTTPRRCSASGSPR